MSELRPGAAMARSLMVLMAASASLVPVAAHATAANHDAQRIVLRSSKLPRHDRALGPVACATQIDRTTAD